MAFPPKKAAMPAMSDDGPMAGPDTPDEEAAEDPQMQDLEQRVQALEQAVFGSQTPGTAMPGGPPPGGGAPPPGAGGGGNPFYGG